MSEWGMLRLNRDTEPPTVYIEEVEEPALTCAGVGHHHDADTDHTNCGICLYTAEQNEFALLLDDAMRRMTFEAVRGSIKFPSLEPSDD